MFLAIQTRATLEKQKQTLEGENADMANEIKMITAAKQESERKRKQLEQQVQELTMRLQEVEKVRIELVERNQKLHVSEWANF